MKSSWNPRQPAGMTLLELTVVILVLLSLVAILFIGSRAWKRGSDRAGCIMNIRQAQMSVRSYQNLNDFPQGHTLDMVADVIGGGFMNDPVCPGSGTYTHLNYIPAVGELVTTCSLAGSERHEPVDYTGW